MSGLVMLLVASLFASINLGLIRCPDCLFQLSTNYGVWYESFASCYARLIWTVGVLDMRPFTTRGSAHPG